MFLHNFPTINQKFSFPTFFLKLSGDFVKIFKKQFHKIISKYLKNVLKISNISPKFSVSIPKYVFQKSPNGHIFLKFFKYEMLMAAAALGVSGTKSLLVADHIKKRAAWSEINQVTRI